MNTSLKYACGQDEYSEGDYNCLSMVALPVAFFFLVSFTESGQIGSSPSGRVLSSKSPLKQLALDAAFIVLLRPGSFHQK